MSQRDDTVRVQHMLEAARKAQEFLRPRSRTEFEADEQLVLSLTRLLEVIGEAASKVSEEYRRSHATIPWPQIVGMRNRLIHAYFDVDLDEIWRTIQDDLPLLVSELEKWVRA